MSIKLRKWQEEALHKSLDWFITERTDRHFLINAAPGAGKTLASCAIAKALIDIGEIEHEVDRADEIAVKAEINLLLPLRMLRRELGDDARVAHVRDALGAEEARGARELASGDE